MAEKKVIHEAISRQMGKKVIVGMTGGVDSAVAAFLLKKQGYQCIGVSIVFLDEDKIRERLKPKEGDEQEVLNTLEGARPYEARIKFLEGSCNVNDLNRVKKICDFLDIPFYAIKATSEYQYYVLDRVVANGLLGDIFAPCVWANNLKMDLLLDRAKILGAEYIATGHYAKVYKHDHENYHELFAASDIAFDQSYSLSRLENVHLERLLLPLSEIRRKDALQIAERFQIPCKVWRDSQKMCFYDRGDISYFIEHYSTKDFKIEGKILEIGTNTHIGDHSGIHMFRVGERISNIRGVKGFHIGLNENYKVCHVFSGGTVIVGPDEACFFTECSVYNIHFTTKVDNSKALPVFIQYSMSSPKVEGTILFKNCSTGKVVFGKKIPDICRGQHLTFYSSNRSGAKVFGCGDINYIGRFDRIDRIEKKRPKLTDDDNDEANQKMLKQQFDPDKYIF